MAVFVSICFLVKNHCWKNNIFSEVIEMDSIAHEQNKLVNTRVLSTLVMVSKQQMLSDVNAFLDY